MTASFRPGADPASDRPTRIRWLIFALACAVSWLLYLHRYAFGVIKPALKRENPELTDQVLGDLDALFSLTYALGQVPGGLAGDVLGQRRVLSLLILLWSAALLGLSWAISFAGLGVARALFGLAQAGAYPNLSQVTRRWFPASIRTTVQGAVASLSGRAGGACAALIIGWLLLGKFGLDWRAALLVVGAGGIALGVAFALLYRNSPAEHPWANAAEAQEVAVGEAPRSAGAKLHWDFGLGNLLTLGAMLVYAFCSNFGDQFFVNWLPQFLEEGRGLSPTEMGLFASLPLLGGALGGTVGGVLNDYLIRRTGSQRWARCAVALTGKTVAALLLALSVTLPDGRAAALTLLACKFFGDWSLSTQWGAVTDIGGRAAGTVFGAVNMVGSLAGVLAGMFIGRFKQVHGWEPLFFVLAGVFLAAALSWLLIDSDRRLVTEQKPLE